MELHPENGEVPVLDRHDLTVGGLSGDSKLCWEMYRIRLQGVVSGDGGCFRAVSKKRTLLVEDGDGLFSVHQLL